jgi:DNA-binding transcriptional MerR regulator
LVSRLTNKLTKDPLGSILNVNVNVKYGDHVKLSSTGKFYSISDLASEFEISPRSIRFYEEKGLLSPKRTGGNQRIYDKRDRARLKLILRGKRFGYSLDEIAEMIGMTATEMGEVEQIEASLAYGDKKLREIRDRIEDLEVMEQDLLTVKEKLRRRLAQLNAEK